MIGFCQIVFKEITSGSWRKLVWIFRTQVTENLPKSTEEDIAVIPETRRLRDLQGILNGRNSVGTLREKEPWKNASKTNSKAQWKPWNFTCTEWKGEASLFNWMGTGWPPCDQLVFQTSCSKDEKTNITDKITRETITAISQFLQNADLKISTRWLHSDW